MDEKLKHALDHSEIKFRKDGEHCLSAEDARRITHECSSREYLNNCAISKVNELISVLFDKIRWTAIRGGHRLAHLISTTTDETTYLCEDDETVQLLYNVADFFRDKGYIVSLEPYNAYPPAGSGTRLIINISWEDSKKLWEGDNAPV